MFKNATLYRIAPEWSADLQDVEDRLGANRFIECGATQPQSMGWIEPRGHKNGLLVESIDGHWMLKLMIEKKVLPGTVVKRKIDEHAKRIEQETGRKPGKKMTKEIKEAAILELLPMAFTKQSSIVVWIDMETRLLVVDAGSQSRADEVVTALVKALDGLAVSLVQTQTSAQVSMSEWLASSEAPAGFSVDRECELESGDENKAVVKYARHMLDIEEVRQHITAGKVPTKLAMTWDDRISFVLTESGVIKKLSFLDVVFEGASSSKSRDDDPFDANAAIATGEMSRMIPDLIEALGGEMPAFGQQAPKAEAPSAPVVAASEASASAATEVARP